MDAFENTLAEATEKKEILGVTASVIDREGKLQKLNQTQFYTHNLEELFDTIMRLDIIP